jgi:serine protease Do
VIGINTSIFGKTFQGISFAVPSSTAQFVFDQLVDDNVVTRGYLGVFPSEVSERFAKEFRLPDLEGAVVDRVQQGSPAYQAGIRRGDVVRRWNGKPVRNFRQLFRFAEASEPGTQVKVDLWRPTDNHEFKTEVSVMVTMQALPQFEPRRPSEFIRER